MNGTTNGLRISSWYLGAFKMPSIKSTCVRCPQHTPTHTITPPPPWAYRSTTLTSANRLPTQRYSRCLPSALYSENRDSSVKRTPLQSARHYRMWAFSHSSRLRLWTAVRSRPQWGWQACRWVSLRWFLTVCAEIILLCQPIVAAAVRVAGLRWSWRWICWMWRSRAGVVTHGLRLWGRLDALPNFLKRLWRQLMVEKWTSNSWQQLWWTFLQSVCQLNTPSKLATSVALCSVIKLHILEWPFIVASLRYTCTIIMLSNQQLYMPHMWGGWIILAKE